jgi:hypothetical protein
VAWLTEVKHVKAEMPPILSGAESVFLFPGFHILVGLARALAVGPADRLETSILVVEAIWLSAAFG